MTDNLRRRTVLRAAADSGDLGRNLEAAIAAFKLIEADRARWRAVNAPHLVALIPTCTAGQTRLTPRTMRHAPPAKTATSEV